MRLLITGANGLLGSKLSELSVDRGHKVYSGYLSKIPTSGVPIKLDLCNISSINQAFEKIHPEVVLHCAALTDVDKCEVDKDLAININVDGTRLLAYAAKKVNSNVIFISTDYVFNGKKGLYKENDEPRPINFYGHTKLLAETALISSGAKYLIARTSVIYGSRPASGKVNFALYILEQLNTLKKIKVLTDQFITPTLNSNLADMLLEATERGLKGLYHMSGATRVSRYEFSIKLAEAFNLNKNLIREAKMSDFQSIWKAKRPKDSSLDVSKAINCLNRKPMYLNDALIEFKKEVKG
jgi:dTDP-4-dehydrorhamnose reductase